jgi:hypothetical protein
MKYIIYENLDHSIGITTFNPALSFTQERLLEAGRRTTPKGLPFWIIEKTDFPEDHSLRREWTKTDIAGVEREPDGTGELEVICPPG